MFIPRQAWASSPNMLWLPLKEFRWPTVPNPIILYANPPLPGIKSSSILLQPLRQRIRHGTYPYSNKARSIALAASNSEFLSTRCLRLFKASFIVDTA
ncbi:hypothetical protein PSTT_08709 [Puccinia striiformis]|uniref:Uncharacterized protein n=1 Tax=Puccinia striiformis TaxID=27350 RepID=A0A2S4VBC0_9BASI|nr:hypothetical protein PSTT_08709 [Puccinia striiformis]